MIKSLFTSLALLLLIYPAEGAPPLVRYTHRQLTDDLGYTWGIDENGGVRGVFSAMEEVMTVWTNGSPFSAGESQMTQDGREVFMKGNGNGLEVARRVRIDQRGSFVRYFDTVRSTDGAAQTVHFIVHINFFSPMDRPITDTGAPLGEALGRDQRGFLFTSPADKLYASLLFLFSGPGAKVRPTVQGLQDRRYQLTYTFRLAAGESVALAYVVAQRGTGPSPDGKKVAELLAPLQTAHLLDDIPLRDRKQLVNFAPASFMTAPFATSIHAFVEKLGVERGPADVLAIGTETRLKGRATCARLELETARGRLTIPLENVAALVGGAREPRVLLRDGQALHGKLTASGLLFTPVFGAPLPLDPATLDRLVLRPLPGDAPAAGSWGWIETGDGDRFAVKADPAWRLRAKTAWGGREISQAELLGCAPAEESPLALRTLLRDGSSLLGFLEGETLPAETVLFGPQSFAVPAIRQIAVLPSPPAAASLETWREQPQVLVSGEQILGGRIELPELHFITSAGEVPVTVPFLRALQALRPDGEARPPQFTLVSWDGSVVTGALREPVLPVRSGRDLFQVPARDLVSVVGAPPELPEALRGRIADLLRELSDPATEKRDGAARELGALGALARAGLAGSLAGTNDADVRRRAGALLDAMDRP